MLSAKLLTTTGSSGQTFLERLLSTETEHLIAAWPLDDATGTAARDASGNGRTGTYNSDVSGWPVVDSGLGTTWPTFSGDDRINVYSTSLRDIFNGAAGTLLIAGQIAAEQWTDATTRRWLYFWSSNDNLISISKAATNNLLTLVYRAGGISETVNITTSSTDLIVLALTWDKAADEVKVYIDGVQTGGTQTGLGTWAGTLSATQTYLGGGGSGGGSNPFIGNLGMVAVWDVALTADEVEQVSSTPPFSVGLGFDDDAIRFIWQTDSHETVSANPSRALAIEAAINDVNTWRPNAYIHTGDHGDNFEYNVRSALRRERKSGRPTIFVNGNHDEHDADEDGVSNWQLLETDDFYNQSAPFVGTAHMTSGDRSLTALCIWLDCNLYDDDPNGGAPGNSPILAPGDRLGFHESEPIGGYWRQFGAEQIAWFEAQLAADTNSQIVLVCTHYPPLGVTCTDFAQVADALQADGRPAIGFCGHIHAGTTIYTLDSTDEQATYNWYRMPAAQESGCWCRATLRLVNGAISMDEMELHNYTDPGGWTISAPFTLTE